VLERDGFITRKLISTFPLRVEYALTLLGRAVAYRLIALFSDLESHLPAVLAAQRQYDGRATD
jgi:DNA-binding HxlR family transcriptional regulator